MSAKGLIQLVVLVSLFEVGGNCQSVKLPPASEQSRFAVEGAEIAKPKDIPDTALQILRQDKYVFGCLKEGQPPSDIPGSWFVGSEIHLNGSETDLIVLPRQKVLRRADAPAENACLYEANVAPFWVFRKMPGGYGLVLDISVAGAESAEHKII